MKKLFFLPVLVIMFSACSTDSEDLGLFEEDAVVFTTMEPSAQRFAAATKVANCFFGLTGNVSINLADGFNNPKLVFVADVPSNTSQVRYYSAHLEMQLLTDCEDINSGTGTISRFSLYNVAIPSLSDPRITLLPSQLPSTCYRWRWVVEIDSLESPCVTRTPWYEEPLF